MSYSKRMKAHWNVGKSCKGTRKAKEADFIAAEIEEQLADDSFRYHFSKRKPNKLAQLEYRVQWYRETIERYERDYGERGQSYISYLRTSLMRDEKQLEKLKTAKPQ